MLRTAVVALAVLAAIDLYLFGGSYTSAAVQMAARFLHHFRLT